MRANAYAPYSVYHVGAAILGADGRVYVGCNVENASFGLTMCAERVALGCMVANGCKTVAAVAIVTRDGASPCGMCRQSLAEFVDEPDSLTVWLVDDGGNVEGTTLGELWPKGFRLRQLRGDGKTT